MKTSLAYLESDTIPELCPMVRSEGIHVSQCLTRICVRLNHFVPSLDRDLARMELGSCWEEGLKSRLYREWPNRFYDIGEIEHSGIFGTPDVVL